MSEVKYRYEKIDENGKTIYCPLNDYDGSVTGHIVFGVKAWFDENPEERKRLGWIKHIVHGTSEVDYDSQTQYLAMTTNTIDEYTVEDEYHVMTKSEEMLALEDMLEAMHQDFPSASTGNFIHLITEE